MVSQILQGVIAYTLLSPIFIWIGASSLEYYVAKDRISAKAVEIFLARLSFPLDRIYADVANYLDSGLAKSPMEHLQNASYSRSRISRIVLSIVIMSLIIAGVIGQIRPYQLRADYILLQVLLGFSLYRAWRFGHKLVNIEASIHQQ